MDRADRDRPSAWLSEPGEGAVLVPASSTATATIGSNEVPPTSIHTIGPGGGSGPDRTRPLAFVSALTGQTAKTLRSTGLRLSVVSGEAATGSLTVSFDSASARRLKLRSTAFGRATATFSAAGVRTVTIRPSSKVKSALKKARRGVRLRASLHLTDRARNRSSASSTSTLAPK